MNSSYTGTGRRSRRPVSPVQNFFLFLLKYALPFLAINGLIFFLVTTKPQLSAETGSIDDYLSTQVIVRVKSFLPTKNLTASMDGKELVLTQNKKGQYSVTIEQNGVLELYIENMNGMSSTVFQSIDILDDTPPAIAKHYVEDGILTFELEDSQSGVDFSSIHAINSKEEEVSPLTIDKVKGSITFTMDPDGLTVFVKDMSGHEIQATFTSHMESGKEVSETTSEEVTDSPEGTEEGKEGAETGTDPTTSPAI